MRSWPVVAALVGTLLLAGGLTLALLGHGPHVVLPHGAPHKTSHVVPHVKAPRKTPSAQPARTAQPTRAQMTAPRSDEPDARPAPVSPRARHSTSPPARTTPPHTTRPTPQPTCLLVLPCRISIPIP